MSERERESPFRQTVTAGRGFVDLHLYEGATSDQAQVCRNTETRLKMPVRTGRAVQRFPVFGRCVVGNVVAAAQIATLVEEV